MPLSKKGADWWPQISRTPAIEAQEAGRLTFPPGIDNRPPPTNQTMTPVVLDQAFRLWLLLFA